MGSIKRTTSMSNMKCDMEKLLFVSRAGMLIVDERNESLAMSGPRTPALQSEPNLSTRS